MKKLFPLIFFLLLMSISRITAQDDVPDFHTPKEWRGETLKLPPGFAPDLKWGGVEHIRFAPGMFKPDSDSFFSYVLVFLLSKDDDISSENMQAQVLTYYRGLAKAVMGGKGQSVKAEDFQLKLEQSKDKKNSWHGVLDWVEPFATQKPQNLNLEVNLWKRKDSPVLYFCVSPQKKDHEIWKEMRKYRDLFQVSGETLSKF